VVNVNYRGDIVGGKLIVQGGRGGVLKGRQRTYLIFGTGTEGRRVLGEPGVYRVKKPNKNPKAYKKGSSMLDLVTGIN